MEDKYKIHAFYIIFIFVSVIVVLISVNWAKIPGLVEYITFALTLSSLILAILAIIYSMVSNSSFTNIIQTLNTSSTQLEKTSKEINESNKILYKEIEKIPGAIDSVDKNVISTRSYIENLSLSNISEDDSDLVSSSGLKDEFVERFLSKSAFNGLQSLFCVVLSNKTKTAFNWEEISKEIPCLDNKESYLHTYFRATQAFGLLNAELDGKKRYIIHSVHQVLQEKVEKQMYSWIETAVQLSIKRNSEENIEMNEEEVRAHWMKNVLEIQQYFGVST